MLTALHIERYRQFEDFKLENLKQVNLIVGKNTVGKSSVLEAIRILLNRNKIDALVDIALERNDYVVDVSKEIIFASFDPLFMENYENIIVPSIMINSYSEDNIKNSIEVFIDLDVKDIVVKEDDVVIESSRINKVAINKVLDVNIDNRYRCLNVNHHPVDYYYRLWKHIRFTGDDRRVVDLISAIIEDIEEIDYLYAVVVKIKGINRPIPLGSFGEGVKRLFNMALEMVYARDKVLLIDEFEIGLHHSIQEQIWDATLMMAQALNVQVFATTHSQDCVYGFARALNKRDDIDGQAIRLEKHEGRIYAVEMDKALLKNIEKFQTEIR
jgi:AAA15 family ATPase/GTPase